MKNNVIIIGAGIAGLAAANRLIQSGIRPIILEARNRAGGRIITDYSLGLPIDLGAAWLHGIDGNPVADIAKQLKLTLNHSEYTNIYFSDKRGQKYSLDEVNHARHHLLPELISAATQFAKKQKNDMSLLEACHRVAPTQSELLSWSVSSLGYYSGADLSQLSAQYWDTEMVLKGGNFLITSGYNDVITYLAKKVDIFFDERVSEVNYHNDLMEVVSDKHAWKASQVIITVPLGVLKNNDITFNPPLPVNKQTAIRQLGMGVLNRIVLKFPRSFVPKDNHLLYLSRAPKNHVNQFINYGYHDPMSVLIGFTSGSQASAIETLSDQAIIDMIMHDLFDHFGKMVPEPESYLISRWSLDPFSYGSYSYIPVGASSDHYDQLAKSVGDRLFFAGEACYKDYLATTHGAYLSGINAAESLLSAYSERALEPLAIK